MEAATQRPKCRACGAPFDLASRRPFYQGDDPHEARRVASRVALQVGGAGIEAIAESVAAAEAERRPTVDDVVRTLEKKSEFSMLDLEAALAVQRVTASPDRVVERLRAENRVFEPRPGRFRWVA